MAAYLERRTLLVTLNHVRHLSMKKVNKNLVLFSRDKLHVDQATFKVDLSRSKGLVVMPSWLMVRDSHLGKFAKFYFNYDYDLLGIKLQPWQLLWPTTGTQVVAANILKFLETNKDYSPLILHGFSIGGYLWGEALVQMEAEKKRYESIVNRISGQIFDSLADITHIPIGTPMALFPNNKFLQVLLRSYLTFHLKTFETAATRHYRNSRAAFHDNLIRTPMLLFAGANDPIAPEESLRALKDYWQKNGLKVTYKVWDSPHISHMFKHPEEYSKMVMDYLEEVKAISSSKRI